MLVDVQRTVQYLTGDQLIIVILDITVVRVQELLLVGNATAPLVQVFQDSI